MKKKLELINKSIAASILIALGDYALLKLGNPLGPVLFSLGLSGLSWRQCQWANPPSVALRN